MTFSTGADGAGISHIARYPSPATRASRSAITKTLATIDSFHMIPTPEKRGAWMQHRRPAFCAPRPLYVTPRLDQDIYGGFELCVISASLMVDHMPFNDPASTMGGHSWHDDTQRKLSLGRGIG